MIGRRQTLIVGAALAVATPIRGVSAAPPSDLRFEVFRNDSRIGHHTISFHAESDTTVANVAVEIVVRLGPIPVFRYTHAVRETWRGDRFLSLESETYDDGTPYHVEASNAGEHVVVTTRTLPRVELPPETIPLTHWNQLCMRRPMFNPQDGAPVESTVAPRGEEMVALADGREVRATHYSLVGKIALEDWYDAAGKWTALRSIGHDGSRIEYRLAG
jgi:hypothetical protein